ncbi:cobalt ABC transporter permease, partial [Cellulomonas bogoriensis 69B4 = DSM 16987]
MHPLAWWAWALCLALAVTRAGDVVTVLALAAAVVLVVVVHRQDTPWGRAFTAYLVLAGLVVVLRVVFHVLVGIKPPGPVLLDLPVVPAPGWAVNVELLGPVTVPGLLGAVAGGVRLGALILCFGAANTLVDPRRALRSLPAALHQIGTAVVIAVSLAPQLVSAALAVRRAQRLRGMDGRGPRTVLAVVPPVLSEALDRSLTAAASMDARGYARAVGGRDRRVGALVVLALLAATLGTYGILDGTTPAWLGVPVLVAGGLAAVVASVLAGRQVLRSRYRPDTWGPVSWLVTGCGVVAVVTALAGAGLPAGDATDVVPAALLVAAAV